MLSHGSNRAFVQPCEACCEQAMQARSLGAPTWLKGCVWLWHGALLGVRRHLHTSSVAFPVVLERLSNTPAHPQEPSPCTPELSRVRPVVSKRCRHAHSGRLRGLGRVWLWHDALLGMRHHLRTSSVAFPFVLERLSNPPARLHEAPPRCRARASDAGTLTRGAHVAWWRHGFSMARSWGLPTP